MKKRLLPVFFVLIGITIMSCSEEHLINEKSLYTDEETIVLTERASSEPFLLSNKSQHEFYRAISTNSLPGVIDIQEYLGRAYNLELGDIGSVDGVRFPVLDINRYITDHPDSYLAKRISQSIATSVAFSNFDRYEEKLNKSRKISSGFKLDLKIFSIGAKSNYVSSFSSVIVNESTRVFGELDVYIKDSSYELLTSSNSLKRMKRYLSSSFLEELYNTSNKELLNNYGGVVITDFVSGGRATALYSGKHIIDTSHIIKEKSLEASINASFTFSGIKPSLDFGIGNVNGSAIALENNIFDFEASIKTYGGDFGYGTFTTPKKIDDININLSAWANSLNDRSKSVLIDINDNGLRPISDFIRESNFSHNINESLSGKLSLKDLETPRIEARWIRINHNQIGMVVVVLKTRFGDELRISDDSKLIVFNKLDEMLAFAQSEANKKLPYYKLEAVATKVSDGYYGTRKSYKHSISDIQEGNMSKFIDDRTNILYLLSNVNGSKFAYSIHDDYILDTYGIRDWVSNLPSLQITYDQLDQYVIVGL